MHFRAYCVAVRCAGKLLFSDTCNIHEHIAWNENWLVCVKLHDYIANIHTFPFCHSFSLRLYNSVLTALYTIEHKIWHWIWVIYFIIINLSSNLQVRMCKEWGNYWQLPYNRGHLCTLSNNKLFTILNSLALWDTLISAMAAIFMSELWVQLKCVAVFVFCCILR